MSFIEIKEPREVVPVGIEDNLLRRHIRPQPFGAGFIKVMRFACSDLLYSCLQVEEENNTQCAGDDACDNCLDQSVVCRPRRCGDAVEKRLELRQYVTRQP